MRRLSDLIVFIVFWSPIAIMLWEASKETYYRRKERNSVWIGFKTIEGASEAARRVDHYYAGLDNGKRAEARVVSLRTNPAIEVLVPKAMLVEHGLDDAMQHFRNEVNSKVTGYANALHNVVAGDLEHAKERKTNEAG